MTDLTPREIVSELDRFVIGQGAAKRAVAIALRNRWRRKQLEGALAEEVLPKNILMIGPTGCGKTEIARRIAKLAGAPFLKVEATKFTEVGYVGRDVEQILRDLLEVAIALVKDKHRTQHIHRAEEQAQERVIDALVGKSASTDTRQTFRRKLTTGELDDKEITVEVQKAPQMPMIDLPGMGGQMGMFNLSDILGKGFGLSMQKRTMKVKSAMELLSQEEAEKLMDQEVVTQEAIRLVESEGIVFIDEIDKICAREGRAGGEVSREGVQRDLLPLIEGTTVTTKHGQVRSDHVLFIASGAFHVAKPSDFLPELQGRLPIRVELDNLTRDDFVRILNETETSLIVQSRALMGTENVDVKFTSEGVDAIADIAAEVNSTIENIGARRLQTVLERVLDDISFTAPDMSGETVTIDEKYVKERVKEMSMNADLSRFIL